MAGLISGLMFWLGLGLVDGPVFGVAVGVASGISQRPSAISRPGKLLTQGLLYDLMIFLAFGLAIGLMVASAWGHVLGLTSELAWGIFSGIGFGLAFSAFWTTDSPWPRYFVASRILARRRQLPTRPTQFLDWAYAAGLLRLSGISVQFRHHDLQDRLTNTRPPERAIRGDADQDLTTQAIRPYAGGES
jgi:hypothetical protein